MYDFGEDISVDAFVDVGVVFFSTESIVFIIEFMYFLRSKDHLLIYDYITSQVYFMYTQILCKDKLLYKNNLF